MGIRIKLARINFTSTAAHATRLGAWTRKVALAAYRGRRRAATAAVVLVAVWLSYHVVFGSNGMLVYQEKRSEYYKLKQEIQVLQKENDRYTQQIKALKSDPEAIEREAREQLRYAKPGEVIYVLPAQSAPSAVSTNTAKK
jgi:cell division protein FtsB